MGRHTLPRRRKRAQEARKIGASVLATAVVASTTLGASLITAPAASAAQENGYVFNDQWTLVNPGSAATENTLPAQRNAATYTATSQLPMRTGNIGIRMEVTEAADTVKGTNYLDAVNAQDYWQANSSTFLGSPTVANLPAVAFETNPSNCGAFNSIEKVNSNGVCEDTSEVTITFDKQVTDPVLDVSGLGGYIWARARDSSNDPWSYRGGFLQQQWNLLTQGVSLQAPTGTNPSNMTITPTSFKPSTRNANGTCYSETQDNAGASNASPRSAAGACGSVLLRGTFDTVTFRIDHDVAPFTAFSSAEYGTGSDWFANNRKNMDGINGLNATWGESPKLPNNTIRVQNDQAHFSLRLPQTGAIGDRVWNDANGNGIQDDGEAGLQGVTVELLDENGQPVLDANGTPITTTTDANGAYRFEDLPLGKYKVRFSGAPEGMSPTTPGAGADRTKDSDIDVSGVTGVVELNSDAPVAEDVDAGYTAAPTAKDDESLNNAQGSTVTVPVLGNDTGNLDPSTVKIKDPSGNPVDELVVPGEGKWTVNPENGEITFTPEPGFTKNPTPINYTVKDINGKEAGAKVTVTYKPEASDDESLNNPRGTAVKVPTLANDKGDLDPSTVKITDPSGQPVDSLTVPGEGVWTVDPASGDVTFTPEQGFQGNPTPINYTVKDKSGNQTGAKITVTYVDAPTAKDDESLNNAQGSTVTVPVLGNDTGDLDPSTVKIKDPSGNPVDELVVPGEGKWTVNPENGDITFTPEPGFTKNPTPVNYTVKDRDGQETGAKVTVTYKPEAVNDESLNNKQGTAVTVPTLKNDKGDLDPSTVKLKDSNGNPVDELVVPGEGKWTVDPATGDVTFTPEEGFTKNPTPVDYTVKDKAGNETGAKVTVTYVPEATDDESLNNPQGTAVKVPVLGNDKGDLDPSTVKLKDKDGKPVSELTVPGEGKWTVDPTTGDVTFTPEEGFTKNPTPVDYTVKDKAGNETGAKVTVTYKPEAVNDESLNNKQGSTVTVPTLKNDKGDLDPSTVKIKDKDGNPVDSLTVPGEGKWTVDPKTGDVTFTPEEGFTKNPTPVDYTVKDKAGNETGAKVTVTYLPEAVNDESLNNKQGSTVTVPTLKNDKGDLDPSTVKIKDKDGNPVDSLTVPGEGTWTVNPENGDITFTPEDGFKGNPTPVDYTVKDKAGNETGAKVTVTYVEAPAASDDQSLNNTPGTAVKVPVLSNDKGDLDPSTVKLKDKDGNPVSELVVPGEGKWTVDPKTGDVTFTPEPGFTKNPTPVDYVVKDKNGNETGAKVTVTYKPEATDDQSLNNKPGTAVKVPVLRNDKGDLDPTTVKLKDKDGKPVSELTVPGEGKWTVDPKTGDVTFTPEDGFKGNPTPVDYTVKDKNGNETGAKVTVTYLQAIPPVANNDESRDNKPGTAVTVPVLGNDKGNLDPSTVKIIDPGTGNPVDKLVVPGEGSWTVDPVTGNITFTPEKGFTGNPTPIQYLVKDVDGTEVRATVTVTYLATVPATPAPGNPAEPGNPAPGDDLANTGANLSIGTIAAGALLFLGGAALLIFRRRRQH